MSAKRGPQIALVAMAWVTALSVMSACDAPADAPAAQPPSPTTPAAPAPSATTPSAPAPTGAGDPPLQTADADQVLIEPMSGTGRAHTAWFQVPEKKYTIRVACTGAGTIAVSPGGEKVDVPCDGTTRRVHVATDEKKERVSVTAVKGQRWTVSIVVSADFADAGESPSSLSL
jgi:hypothetical protein